MTAPQIALVTAEHLGKLHPFEHAVVLVLAFGPILLLAITIRIARKRAEEDD
ncbi:hypothetical protein ABIE44_002963 [Marmoricola sp. OAE513]|uniref:hypothetical protein n=1 Tax=Marmoricola sp. OAE513 TaxID=2817894 RepID=UPI001AE4761E